MVDTVEETRVTTETVELYVCPSCEQSYEPAEMVGVGLGVDAAGGASARAAGTGAADRSVEEYSMLCATCADSIFGYDGATGSIPDEELSLSTTTEAEDAAGGSRAYYAVLGSLAAWVVLFAAAGSMDPEAGSPLLGLVVLAASVALPVAVLLDLRSEFADHDLMPYLYAFPALSAIWGLNLVVGGVYLLFRHLERGE